ncbi:MAG: hypothetical protein AB1705_09685 [Verrucomicrobiota bacterium]
MKQVGLAFSMFHGDNGGASPFYATNSPAYRNSTSAWIHFQAMSNQLASIQVLLCPSDITRLNRKAFPMDFSASKTGFANPIAQNSTLSYFVNLAPDETNPQTILTGDRNLAPATNAAPYSSVTTGGPITVPPTAAWSQLPAFRIHPYGGNIALADGSVQQFNSQSISNRLIGSTNLILFPQ